MFLLEWLGIQRPRVLGVDIGSTTVKILELSWQKEAWTVEAYAVAPIGDAAAQDKENINAAKVSAAITTALSKARFTLNKAAVALPGAANITKIIQMPALVREQELAAQVFLEAEKHIPYAIDEVYLDFQVLGPNAAMPDQNDILLVVAKAEAVECRVNALQMAGLEPVYIDIESYVLERAFQLLPPPEKENELIALVDIGASNTALNIFQNGQSIYAREQEFGGCKLTEAIMQTYGYSKQEAGFRKRQKTLPEDYLESVLIPFEKALVQEIKRGLDFFYSSSAYSGIDRVILAGATVQEGEMFQRISDGLNVPTTLANPLTGMKTGSKVDRKGLKNDQRALLVGLGLAMRSLTG